MTTTESRKLYRSIKPNMVPIYDQRRLDYVCLYRPLSCLLNSQRDVRYALPTRVCTLTTGNERGVWTEGQQDHPHCGPLQPPLPGEWAITSTVNRIQEYWAVIPPSQIYAPAIFRKQRDYDERPVQVQDVCRQRLYDRSYRQTFHPEIGFCTGQGERAPISSLTTSRSGVNRSFERRQSRYLNLNISF